jgi:allantoicase
VLPVVHFTGELSAAAMLWHLQLANALSSTDVRTFWQYRYILLPAAMCGSKEKHRYRQIRDIKYSHIDVSRIQDQNETIGI